MNQLYIWIIVALVVTGGGAYWYSASQPDDPMMQDEGAMSGEDGSAPGGMDDGAMSDEDGSASGGMDEGAMSDEDGSASGEMEGDAMMKAGSYEAYSPEKLSLADSGDVVLFFRATWCPTCKILDTDIRSHLSGIPEGLTILDVDYDNSASLKQKYGVTYQHTLVQVRSDGSMIAKWSGSPTLAALVSEVK
ncbi:MAG: thioredoxin family protein [Patescibacteria group bacterium]|nr:thioredoxin family protein [Patescibacteria group bacterium]